jgi:broad specificity phosphatase PhoE
MTLIYLVQHGEKEPGPGDPGLTGAGREQAGRTGRWLHGFGLNAVYGSPQRRAWETAEIIASVCGLRPRRDVRLRERMNWADGQALEEFLAEWARSVRERDYMPGGGDSSRRAGERLRAFLLDVAAEPGPVAVATHGGGHRGPAPHAARRGRAAPRAAARGRPVVRGHHVTQPGCHRGRLRGPPVGTVIAGRPAPVVSER